jgi:outer membrane biosynthesis protein TonB
MNTAAANSGDLNLRSYVVYSLVFHALFTTAVFTASFLERRGNAWGGVGGNLGGTKVSLVRSAGIPMPHESAVTESKVADPTKTLHKEEPPKPKPPEPKTDATKIPKFEKEKPLPPSRKSRILEDKTPEPDNAVPGHNGGANLPTGLSQTPGASSGVSVLGQGSSDFAGRYPYYVDGIPRRITQSWDQSTINHAVLAARKAHTIFSFRINADGTISNIKMVQSSGDWSMDNSAQRALATILSDSSQFRPLPNDYMGKYLDVTFDFDLSLIR